MSSESDRQKTIKKAFSSYKGNSRTGNRTGSSDNDGSAKLAAFREATADSGDSETNHSTVIEPDTEAERNANRLISDSVDRENGVNRSQQSLNKLNDSNTSNEKLTFQTLNKLQQQQFASANNNQNSISEAEAEASEKSTSYPENDYRAHVNPDESIIGRIKRGNKIINDKISQYIPSWEELQQKENELFEEHPTIEKIGTVTKGITTYPATTIFGKENSEAFAKAAYTELQEHPYDAAILAAESYALTGGFSLLSKAGKVAKVGEIASRVPVVGSTIAKYGEAAIGAGLLTTYGVDVNERVNEPIVTDSGIMEPTSTDKAARLGTITAGEILPFAAGMGAYAKLNPESVVITESETIPLKEVEFIDSFTITNGKQSVKTSKVISDKPITVEELRATELLDRELTARITVAESNGGVTKKTLPYDSDVVISQSLEIGAKGQRTLPDPQMEILSTKKSNYDVSVQDLQNPVTKIKNLNEYNMDEANNVLKFDKGYTDKYGYEGTEQYIRGKIIGSQVEAEEIALSGGTGKLTMQEGVIHEGSWTQAPLDEFSSFMLKREYLHESNTFGKNELIAATGKSHINPSVDLLKPEVPEVINTNIKPDVLFRKTNPKVETDFNVKPTESVAESAILEPKSKAKPSARNAEGYTTEQVVNVRSAGQKEILKTSVFEKPKLRFGGLPVIASIQNVNTIQNVTPLQIQNQNQTMKQLPSFDVVQTQASKQVSRQAEDTITGVKDITETTRSRGKTKEPLIIAVPSLDINLKKSSKKGILKKSGKGTYDYSRTTNTFKNPADIDIKGVI
jgi:hypothetical protein